MKKTKSYFILIPAIALLLLGALNIYRKAVWKEPSDGVTWKTKPSGITAIKVEINSPAYLTGIKKGDVLYKVNDNLIETRLDITKNLWALYLSGQKVIYEISRQGELIHPSFYLQEKKTAIGYFYLALIGLTSFVICLIVLFNTKRPFSPHYIYFYILSLTVYSLYIFSATGALDYLDSAFFWLDKTAFLLFPPLLFLYFSIFPQRKGYIRKHPAIRAVILLPAVLLFLGTAALHLPSFKNMEASRMFQSYSLLEKAGILHFCFFILMTLFTLSFSTHRAANIFVKKQYTWIAYGFGFGMVPYIALYLVPLLLGQFPTRITELTILFQALVPLTIAYSISRYKLMDFEVLLKKAATLAFSYFVIASVYLVVSSQTKIFSENKLNALMLGILAIVLGATLFSPLKRLFQSLLDRMFYRRSYKYRKTLLLLSQELSRERNLERLSQKLLELIANALSLKSIALLLTEDEKNGRFSVLKSRGELPPLPPRLSLDRDVFLTLKNTGRLSYETVAERRELRQKYEQLSLFGFTQLLALKVEEKLIGCLGMGKKLEATYLNSEDWELLTTISFPVALAIENAYLYDQAGIRTKEMERLKDYSENIIESLTVGVAVLDQEGRIIGWNRVLEETLQKKKRSALGKNLFDILGEKNFSAIFPSDTQQDFRLLSEIQLHIDPNETRIFDIAKTPLLDNSLNPYGTIIVFEDITDKIHLQQQLMTSEKLASIGLLSAGVAHEINTPLTGISSYVQMLQKRLSEPHFAQILEKIETQTERVGRIIKNLLNFARNPSETAYSRVNLIENLKEILALIDYKLKAMNIDLELHDVPLRPLWAQGERLQQVFINLILNAVDAMPEGGTLTIDVQEQDNEVLVRIADTGTGIKKQHLSHIFDPFFTTKGIGKGTGLGLSISYAIIKEHEGQILVDSTEGKGSTFTVVLPTDLDVRWSKGRIPRPRE